MRKVVLSFMVAGANLALTAGIAMAATKNGGSGNDTLRGTGTPTRCCAVGPATTR